MRKHLGENADQDKRDKWRGKNAIHHPVLLKVKSNSLMWFCSFFFFFSCCCCSEKHFYFVDLWTVMCLKLLRLLVVTSLLSGRNILNSRYIKNPKYNNRFKRRRKREHSANRTWEQPSGAGRDPPSGWNPASFIDSSGSLCKFFTHSLHDTLAPWFSTSKRRGTSWYEHISTLFQSSDAPNFLH